MGGRGHGQVDGRKLGRRQLIVEVEQLRRIKVQIAVLLLAQLAQAAAEMFLGVLLEPRGWNCGNAALLDVEQRHQVQEVG